MPRLISMSLNQVCFDVYRSVMFDECHCEVKNLLLVKTLVQDHLFEKHPDFNLIHCGVPRAVSWPEETPFIEFINH